MSSTVQITPAHRLARAALVAVIATTLIGLNGGILVLLLCMAFGGLVGGAFAATGLTTTQERLHFLGGYNALAALGCLSVGLTEVSPGHVSILAILALMACLVIVGGLIRWRFFRPQA